MEQALAVLPEILKKRLMQYPAAALSRIEEIRVRVGCPLEVLIDGVPNDQPFQQKPYIITSRDAQELLSKLSRHSLYAMEEELNRGYITIQGGHRVGLAGKVITEKGHVKIIRDISSFNIRIAKQKIGSATPLISFLYTQEKGWCNTLLIGPPQTGKTTLLRDLARVISSGDKNKGIPTCKAGIVDERSEIAGSVKGVPQHELGYRVDVLDSCPKAEGMMMMIRSMSPDVLVVDEIGRKEDSEAILEAIHAGVRVIATVHGFSLDELYQRPTLRGVFGMKVFDRYVELTRFHQPGAIKQILDREGQVIKAHQKAVVQ